MFRKLLKITGFLALVIFMIATLAFTSGESKNVACKNIEIDFRNDETIKVNKDEILRLVKKADKNVLGEKLSQINSEIIEREIEKHPAVYKADVYKVIAKDSSAYKGILTVKVKHREPVLRVMSNTGSYYLDKWARKIPISTNYTANVVVATGYFNQDFAKNKLLPFVIYIEENDFWSAQIQQIYVQKNGDLILIPLVGDHTIELGKLDNYHEKLRNMQAFYKQVLAKHNWNKYKTVSLKYKNQVIAKRR